MVIRALLGFAFGAASELYIQSFAPRPLPQIEISVTLMGLLFWQYSKGRAWARWLIVALIVAGMACMVPALMTPSSPHYANIIAVYVLLTVPLILVAWPMRHREESGNSDT